MLLGKPDGDIYHRATVRVNQNHHSISLPAKTIKISIIKSVPPIYWYTFILLHFSRSFKGGIFMTDEQKQQIYILML